MKDTWTGMTAAALGRGIANGTIDPVELTEAFLDATQAHQFGDRIYARLTPDRARAEAKTAAARARAGHRLSALDGVPISWKDLYDTAGTATEAGSHLLAGRTPTQDAHVLQNATAAGAICLGKTHMTELAFSGLGLNPKTASPPNINDPSAASGGSSSGAAASVAHGLAPIGIGSDTAGSVRLPAAWNNLVGLKTTAGRLSLDGVVPLCPRFDTVGPLTRTVEDASLMLAVLEGGKPADLTGANLTGVRLGVLNTVAVAQAEDKPRAGFTRALDKLTAAGAAITLLDIPAVTEAMDLALILFGAEAYGTWKDQIEANPSAMFDNVLQRFRGGAPFAAADYVAAWQHLERLRADYHAATAGFDAIVLPTCPILPPNQQKLMHDPEYFGERNLSTLRNTRIGSLMGVPGLTLPTGTPSVGILFQGPPGSEERLLRLGAAAEAALA
ncbi:MAG: amidase family protein [Pseudomonadota bacterium]